MSTPERFREELDEAMAAARAEGARDMRTKIEALADDHSLWAQHRPVVGKFAGMFAAVGCSCMDRVFVAGAESYAQHIAALLADGGEPEAPCPKHRALGVNQGCPDCDHRSDGGEPQ